MLYKSELKKVPLVSCPKLGKEKLKDNTLIAAANETENSKCGKVLCVDYYSAKTKKLQVRFFSDGKNYINYIPSTDKWNKNYIACDSRTSSVGTDDDIELLGCFLKTDRQRLYLHGINYYTYREYTGPLAMCNDFIREEKRKAKFRAIDRKEALFKERTAWFKDFGKGFEKFCDTKAFKNTYIFFSNFDKKHQRKCTCGTCGKSWLTEKTVKHKAATQCPKCGRKALFIAERYQHAVKDKTTVCTAIKHENQLALKWEIVSRRYSNFKPHFDFSPDAYTFFINQKGKKKIVSYFYARIIYYYGYDWVQRNNENCYHEAYVYPDNLKDVFGEKYYNVDIKSALENCNEPIDFIGLLDRLKTLPQTEYLCKLGLVKLASQMQANDYGVGQKFESVLGISKQLLPLYRDFSVTAGEHRIIKATNGKFNAELLRRLRKYKFGYAQDQICDAIDYMSLETLFNYIDKQAALGHYEPLSVISHLNDYYKMLNYFNVPINKSNRKPKNLKESHDKLVERYNAVIQAERDTASKKALEYVNSWFRGYEKDGYCIVIPKSRADFIREGQALSHCVGSEHYYEDHIAGTRMIFFIRKAIDKEKPFCTAEIDMTTFQVLQCYGFGDSVPPKEIKDFIKSFAKSAERTIKVKGALKDANERKAS